MASGENGRSLPKFGEWDAKDPASAEGFTVIFNKARDNKKNGGGTTSKTVLSHKKQNQNQYRIRTQNQNQYPNPNPNQNREASEKNRECESPKKKVWNCFFF